MDFRTATYWHQGLFLQPQHLQRQDLHQQFLQKPLYQLATPHGWGVGKLEFAPDGLAAQHIDIREAQLIFRPNTYVEFPGNAIIAPRAFDTAWTDTDQPLDLYLGLKKLTVAYPNVTVVDAFEDAAHATTRYASQADGQETPDLYGDGPVAQVPIIKHIVRVFFGPELDALDDYDLIPIGQLQRVNDTIQFNNTRVPPCFHLSGSAVLQNQLRDIRDDLSGRMRQLAEYKAPADLQQDLDSSYFTLMQALQALNRQVPLLTHLAETPQIHPWMVYGALRSCVGELSTFSEPYDALGRRRDQPNDEGLPAYDHLNQQACFQAARQLIGRLLNDISAGPEFRVTLEPLDDYRVAAIARDHFAARNRFYLMLQSAKKWEATTQDFLRLARLAAPKVLPSLIDHALPGTDLIELNAPPQGIPKRANARYFRIEQMSAEWEQIVQAAEIGLFWADAPDDLRAQIIVLRG
ncbi:type VI secretion system baseplate subunit TssK [Castellaniella hirudinis]|uniref:type VI secretion system baseplate subunit TssK n=1 Tax=Castellaniella hirudinis TaxID=1144617 RepID=UPI0039C4E122